MTFFYFFLCIYFPALEVGVPVGGVGLLYFRICQEKDKKTIVMSDEVHVCFVMCLSIFPNMSFFFFFFMTRL